MRWSVVAGLTGIGLAAVKHAEAFHAARMLAQLGPETKPPWPGRGDGYELDQLDRARPWGREDPVRLETDAPIEACGTPLRGGPRAVTGRPAPPLPNTHTAGVPERPAPVARANPVGDYDLAWLADQISTFSEALSARETYPEADRPSVWLLLRMLGQYSRDAVAFINLRSGFVNLQRLCADPWVKDWAAWILAKYQPLALHLYANAWRSRLPLTRLSQDVASANVDMMSLRDALRAGLLQARMQRG